MEFSTLFFIAPLGAILGLLFAIRFYRSMEQSNVGNEKMQKIAASVREGAMAYLKQQYRVVIFVFAILFVLFFFMSFVLGAQNKWLPFAFLTAGFFSGLAGYLGMRTATLASNRTAAGAQESLNQGLQVAFRSGAVMGLVVVGLALFDISMWFMILYFLVPRLTGSQMTLAAITTTMLTFGTGASLQALFARVGGGIFTKAADVGADLVGKVEAGLSEDDPINPATIADNVGDNVGDVAGMGADLYESYYGSLLATAALGVAAFYGHPTVNPLSALIAPFIVAGMGIILSIVGMFFVKSGEEATQKELLKALSRGVNISVILITIAVIILLRILDLPMGIAGSVITGLLAGWLIGKSTEYYTSQSFKPTRNVAEQSSMGPATVVLEGLSTGMLSTGFPVIIIGFGIFFSYGFAGGFTNINSGLYGIGFAAVGMLSTLGITLATDAYGPIADNAGGNAEMSGLPPEVRERTDALDSLGNTTAATGKGFAIGSAALTAMALLVAYVESIKAVFVNFIKDAAVLRNVLTELNIPVAADATLETLRTEIMALTLPHWIEYYNITLINPRVIVGIFLGAMISLVFCALTMKSVSVAAGKMIEEVRRQFREIPALKTALEIMKNNKGKDKKDWSEEDRNAVEKAADEADYAKCVEISTKAAQQKMLFPSILAVIVPFLGGLFLGVAGVMGIIVGGLTAGFSIAVFLNNTGGAWDNAKKYIEEGNLGGKGSDAHKAAVVGDTIGDPFKDTSGPALNILIKLMSMVAIVTAGLAVKYAPFFGELFRIGPK